MFRYQNEHVNILGKQNAEICCGCGHLKTSASTSNLGLRSVWVRVSLPVATFADSCSYS